MKKFILALLAVISLAPAVGQAAPMKESAITIVKCDTPPSQPPDGWVE